jgi:hypothetical protein
VSAGIGTLWRFFDRRRMTWKKSRPMPPSRTGRTSEATLGLVRGSTRPRPRPPGVHRRDLGLDEDGAHARRAPRASACDRQSRTGTGRRPPSSPGCGSAAWSRRWCWTGRSTAWPSRPMSTRS